MRLIALASILSCQFAAAQTKPAAAEPAAVVNPTAFPTLVNPNCSHCVDEAKRRGGELKAAEPAL